MSKELINYHNELQAMESIADYAAKTSWFQTLGGKPGTTMIALYARELGLPVMQCLFGGMKSVLGKIEISPVMMNAMIRKSGHKLETIEHTNEKCVLKGIRKDTGEEMIVSFSIEDAKRAKIYKSGGAWETYPKNMTYKSCLSNLAKWLFPDVIGPSYVEGEIDEDNDWNKKTEPALVVEAVKEKVKALKIEEDEKISALQIDEYYMLTAEYPKYQKIMDKKYPDIEQLTKSQFDSFKLHFEEWKKNNPKEEIVEEKIEEAMPF